MSFLFLLVILLAAVSSGLGYWGLQLKQQMDEQQVLIEQMNLWLENTDATLNQTSTTASQSGETLMGRLEQLNKRFDERIKHFDSEVAKLWTISFQRNKPQLESQGEQLTAQAKELEALKTSLTQLNDGLSAQEKKVTGLETESETAKKRFGEINALNTQVIGQGKQITAQSDELKTLSQQVAQLISDVEFQLSVERDERAKLQSDLEKKISAGNQTAALSARIKKLEGLIAGIDNSRQSLTAKLVELQTQISNLK